MMPTKPEIFGLVHKPQRKPTRWNAALGWRWRKIRRQYLIRFPLCQDCGAVADEVHHIRKHRGDKRVAYDWNNLMSLCKHCHQRRTARGE